MPDHISKRQFTKYGAHVTLDFKHILGAVLFARCPCSWHGRHRRDVLERSAGHLHRVHFHLCLLLAIDIHLYLLLAIDTHSIFICSWPLTHSIFVCFWPLTHSIFICFWPLTTPSLSALGHRRTFHLYLLLAIDTHTPS